MPDPQQGLGSPGASHGGWRRKISRWMHKERPKPPETKSNPGKGARRDQHPLLGCWVCCNSTQRQFFGCSNPKTAILMFLSGKTLTFSWRKILSAEALSLWFHEGGKGTFLSQLHQILKRSKKSDPSWWDLASGKKTLPWAESWEFPIVTTWATALQSQGWESCPHF